MCVSCQVITQKQYPVDTSNILSKLELEVAKEEKQYLLVKERADEVNQLSAKEYDDLMQMSEKVKREIEELESQIKNVEGELETMDQTYSSLLIQQQEQQQLKNGIRFDYEDVTRDHALEEAKGNN